MKKVYCNNCRFYIFGWKQAYGFSSAGYKDCKLEKYLEDTYLKKELKFGNLPVLKNKKNDCSDYKHKWWKFWVKK